MDGIIAPVPGNQIFARPLFDASHQALRSEIGAFLDAEIVGAHEGWIEAGTTCPPEIWARAGAAGLLRRNLAVRYGGAGGDFRDAVVVIEELAARRLSGLPSFLQSDILMPFLTRLGRADQKAAYLPRLASGELLGAVALTEPHSGSDLHAIRTTAKRVPGGFALNGVKTHVSNGRGAGLIIVAARTSEAAGQATPGLSLFVVEAPCPGLQRSPIDKVGMAALETAELRFDRCLLPETALLGPEGMGFIYLMTSLVIERLVLAIYAQAAAEAQLRALIAHCDARKTAAGTLLGFQHIRFQLADLFGDCAANRTFVDHCIGDHLAGRLDPRLACTAKLRASETQKQVAALGVQLRGADGVGGPVGKRAMRDLADASAQTIWGGSSEIMRDLIGGSLANLL